MKKRALLRIVFVLTLLSIFTLPSNIVLAGNFSGWTQITGTTTISEDGNYYLDSNVTGNITVNSGVTATIDLNGNVLKSAANNVSVITVNGTLTVIDSNPMTEHRGTLSNLVNADYCLWTWDGTDTTGDFVIKGGIITGGNMSHYSSGGIGGSGVRINSGGNFTLKSGSISGHQNYTRATGDSGAGVRVCGGAIFNMEGGTISYCLTTGNSGGWGGGVSCSGTFNMSGGTIKNSYSRVGGGVLLNGGVFNLTRGTISNCQSVYGAGVHAESSTFNMSGGTVTSCQGSAAVHIKTSSTANITGGSIVNNIGSTSGGVDVESYITLGGNAVIKDNNSTASGAPASNLYLCNGVSANIATGADAPTSGMQVGITTQTAPTAGNQVAISGESDVDYHSYFFADQGGMRQNVTYDSATKKLCLAVPDIAVTQNGTAPVYGSTVNDSSFYTVSVTGFGDAPTCRVEWRSVDGAGVESWSPTSPNPNLSVGTEGILTISERIPAGNYVFRITNSQPEKIDDPANRGNLIDNPNYVSSAAVTLTVDKKTVTVMSGVIGQVRGYISGDTSVVLIMSQAVIDGKVDGDELFVSATGTMTDDAVGTDKEVVISNWTLSGSSSANYQMAPSGNQASTTVTISAFSSSVGTVPVGKTELVYNESPQELVTSGSAINGTLNYALGSDGVNQPLDNWSTNIPTGTDSGTYYVWYKSIGDTDYADTAPVSITVVIAKMTPSAPAGLSGIRPSSYGGSDGKISGTASTMEYSTSSGFSPKSDCTSTMTTGLAAGTYYVRIKETVNSYASPYVAVIIPDGNTPTPDPDPSPAPAPAPQKFTIPVTGDDTVQIEASISGGNAKVSDIKMEDISNLFADSKSGENSTNSTVTIDLSTSKQKVESVTLTKQSVKNLAKAANDEKSPVETVEIRLSNATIVLDSKALETISEQMKGQEIKIVVEDKTKEDLNAAQQEALEEVKVEGTFDAHVESNGVEVHEFNGGNVEVSLSFVPEQGKDPKHYFIYYVADDGSTEKFDTRYEGGRIIFITSHLSDYVIVYDETKTNSTKKAAKAPILKMKKTIGLGKKYALKVTNVAENATVKFTSSDESVATVDKNGVIRATGLGECNIKCVIKQNGTSYKFRITVRVLENCRGNRQIKASECLTPNSTTPLLNIYKLVNADKPVKLNVGKLAKNATVTYSVEDETIAAVSEGGVITGLADGTTGISVYVTQKGQTYQYRLFVRVSTK